MGLNAERLGGEDTEGGGLETDAWTRCGTERGAGLVNGASRSRPWTETIAANDSSKHLLSAASMYLF